MDINFYIALLNSVRAKASDTKNPNGSDTKR